MSISSKTAYVLVDRLKIAPDIRQRLIDSVEICFRENNGEVILEVLDWPSGNGATPHESSFGSAKRSSARSAASDMKIPSRSCFRSTVHSAPARDARDSGTRSISILDLVIPDKNKS